MEYTKIIAKESIKSIFKEFTKWHNLFVVTKSGNVLFLSLKHAEINFKSKDITEDNIDTQNSFFVSKVNLLLDFRNTPLWKLKNLTIVLYERDTEPSNPEVTKKVAATVQKEKEEEEEDKMPQEEDSTKQVISKIGNHISVEDLRDFVDCMETKSGLAPLSIPYLPFCKKCGHWIGPKEAICSKCGTKKEVATSEYSEDNVIINAFNKRFNEEVIYPLLVENISGGALYILITEKSTNLVSYYSGDLIKKSSFEYRGFFEALLRIGNNEYTQITDTGVYHFKIGVGEFKKLHEFDMTKYNKCYTKFLYEELEIWEKLQIEKKMFKHKFEPLMERLEHISEQDNAVKYPFCNKHNEFIGREKCKLCQS